MDSEPPKQVETGLWFIPLVKCCPKGGGRISAGWLTLPNPQDPWAGLWNPFAKVGKAQMCWTKNPTRFAVIRLSTAEVGRLVRAMLEAEIQLPGISAWRWGWHEMFVLGVPMKQAIRGRALFWSVFVWIRFTMIHSYSTSIELPHLKMRLLYRRMIASSNTCGKKWRIVNPEYIIMYKYLLVDHQ